MIHRQVFVITALCVIACSGGRERPSVPNPGAMAGPPDPGQSGAKPSESSHGPPASEAVARTILARRFRASGFRILHDVRVRSDGDRAFDLTVDGYDPDARVGYEYIAPIEVGSDVGDGERRALHSDETYRILIVDPVPQARLIELADKFLHRVAAP
ncbi:MAG: hypothetical protein MJE77_32840 [Proteobacteria bacterium]|nr:hypothetical protein [Pseudomonadota bacterium]